MSNDAMSGGAVEWLWSMGYEGVVKEVGRVRRGRKGVVDVNVWEEIRERWGE